MEINLTDELGIKADDQRRRNIQTFFVAGQANGFLRETRAGADHFSSSILSAPRSNELETFSVQYQKVNIIRQT